MPVVAPIITSRGNQRVKQLRAVLSQPPALRPLTSLKPSATDHRGAVGGTLIGIEGEHLLDEALRSGLRVETVFLHETRETPGELPGNVEVLRLSEEVFRSASATQSPQGIAALVEAPPSSLAMVLGQDGSITPRIAPLLLILDALQDPGNLGTLVRSAEAFGATGLLLLPGSTSPWNGKALRASAGSAFRLPIVACTIAVMRELASEGVHLLAAVGQADGASSPDLLDLTRPTALLIGNEGAGLSRELLALSHACVTLPCTGPVESLNAAVAGSLLLFVAQQQRSRADSQPQLIGTGV